MRGHRSVCLSDFQGVGIGHALITYLASMWKGLGYRVFRNTGHPAEIAAAKRAAEWMMTREPGRTGRDTGRLLKHMAKSRATRLGVNNSPVEVISAGMTPDAVGLYQILIRVSADVTNGGVLSCGDFISPGLYGSGSIFLPIAGR
jgi:hypothetical protein